MSEDDLDLNEENEFLISTRQRRSTAGNKMKKLLEQEVQEMQSRTELLEEDEMDLLFMEEGNDEDFEIEADGSGDSGLPGQNIEEETGGNEMDEMFSESEEESGDEEAEDNEEGERNLRRQEKLESRKLKQRRKTPAVVKRQPRKTESEEREREAKKKAQYEQIKAESLLVSNRRTSQRSSVVANKMEVYEKLSKAEKKRKIIQDRIRRHKESQKEEILTQDDRIRIALETEKINILSLDKYKEQEISKKQSRIALQQRQKMKFKPGETILRGLSCTWEVTPLNEIEEIKHWEEQLKKREKKKKRYNRRPHKKQNVDPKKDEKEIKVKQEIKNEESAFDVMKHTGDGSEVNNGSAATDNTNTEIPKIAQMTQDGDRSKSPETKKEDNNIDKVSHEGFSPSPDDLEKSTEEARAHETSYTSEKGPTSEIEERFQFTKNEGEDVASQPSSSNAIISFSSSALVRSDSTVPSKPVTSISEPQAHLNDPSNISSTTIPSPNTTHDAGSTPSLIEDTRSEEELVYEGPEQLVGKNFVTLYSFPTEAYCNDINKELFGETWATGSSHRSSDVQTICKLTMPEGKIDILDNSSLIPDLSFLSKFPAFGEYDKKVVHDVDSTANKELKIVVKTAPPTGVFLPNGFRKKCLISSKECQYFDPKNGVPYSDVETYKTIQDLQDPIGHGSEEEPNPRYQWFGFGNGGIYLDVRQKPAKGVPDGF